MNKPHVWTIPEINSLPAFGRNNGWFYGLARDESGVAFAEIYPGLGFAKLSGWQDVRYFARYPKNVFLAIRDILKVKP